MRFSRFRSLLGLVAALSTSRPLPSSRAGASLPTIGCGTSGVVHRMTPGDEPRHAAKAAELKQKLKAMVVGAKDAKKKVKAT
jgi:hypothetical protein